MKILHALVGYLAVISLPFHPFAFASPLALAIDYDGYVNTTQNTGNIDSALMEHFLGTVLETCQTVTTVTPNHSDSTLVKHVLPGDIIEARQESVIPYVAAVVAIVLAVALAIEWIEDDNPVRC